MTSENIRTSNAFCHLQGMIFSGMILSVEGEFTPRLIGRFKMAKSKNNGNNEVNTNNVNELEITPMEAVEAVNEEVEATESKAWNPDTAKRVLRMLGFMVEGGLDWANAGIKAGISEDDAKAIAKIVDCEFVKGRRELVESDFDVLNDNGELVKSGSDVVTAWVAEYESGVALSKMASRPEMPSQTVLARLFHTRGIEIVKGRKATEIDTVVAKYNEAMGTPDGTLLDMLHNEYGTSEKKVMLFGKFATPALATQSIMFKINSTIPVQLIQSELVKAGLYEVKARSPRR